jgi:hypothetical protein
MRRLVEAADSIRAQAAGRALADGLDAGTVELEIGGVGAQRVEMVSTQGNLGGRLRWFLCPACGRRAAKLYLPSESPVFLCRHCHGLGYRQQLLREFRNAPDEREGRTRLEKRRRDELKMMAWLAAIMKTGGERG